MAFDSAGNLYVANYLNSIILKYDSHGRASLFYSTGLSNPQGIAFDQSGNLFVANYWSGDILKITPQGVSSVFANIVTERNKTGQR
jgi:DNA-binding beta-propeller fold protein YncE